MLRPDTDEKASTIPDCQDRWLVFAAPGASRFRVTESVLSRGSTQFDLL